MLEIMKGKLNVVTLSVTNDKKTEETKTEFGYEGSGGGLGYKTAYSQATEALNDSIQNELNFAGLFNRKTTIILSETHEGEKVDEVIKKIEIKSINNI